ncbi:MAG: hypothetical protein ABIR81_06785 [Ginsengibacter sp.]
MHKLIAEYLLQSDTCSLPPLGVFTRAFNSAKIDSVNKLIYPPYHNFQFQNIDQPVSKGIIEFISYRKDIDASSAISYINDFLKKQAQEVKNGAPLCFDNIGCLQLDEARTINFVAEEIAPLLPVLPAEKIIHADTSHNVLVGDRETTSQVMKDFYTEKPVIKFGKWKFWAAILIAAGLIIIIASLYNKGFTPDSIGNNHHLKVDDEPETYKIMKNEK